MLPQVRRLRLPASRAATRAAPLLAQQTSRARGLGHRSCSGNAGALKDAHTDLKLSDSVYNPEWTATGVEAAVDTNEIPWIPLAQHDLSYKCRPDATGFGVGVSCKPLRASDETGAFTLLLRLEDGAELPSLVHLGAADLYVLSGELRCAEGSAVAQKVAKVLTPGYWGYIPSLSKVNGMKALRTTELLMTFYGPAAFLAPGSNTLSGIFAAADVKNLARRHKLALVPQTLAEALEEPTQGRIDTPDREDTSDNLEFCKDAQAAKYLNDCLLEDGGGLQGVRDADAHFVDTRRLPWIVNGDIGLKIIRVSPETGVVSALVRQNGQAAPHYHLGAADFFITSGRIGYRAGPKEGYGPGVYMYEPAGARHEATQRVGDEDLIYTANLFGPIQFDDGVGTPPTMVLSWMSYLEMAKANASPLIQSKLDKSYLASTEE
eukprot:TRINITY_DN12290_c0_g1_i1.p1 TRINITY_DN12290_c0_g1~~TRINITY_DN12290_c0_g1_i1.p1  ORF type:complete len:434 (+),score=56.59 TRINITY_DN12290_c0_g1_i1:89-1390(+)